MGHEVVGTITEIGDDAESWKEGDRAVLQPALGCLARQIDPPCERCAEGRLGLCVNVTKGCVGPGIQTGFARDTGGGWSESFIAHRSQLHRVPDSLDDATAVLAEPYACAIHASMLLEKLANSIKTIFVVGCGAIGLLTIAALRAAGGDRRIVAAARYPHQRELAREFGADDVLPAPRSVQEQYPLWSETLGAELHKAEIGKPVVMGGADATLDCVGSSRSIDDALRFTRSGGAVVLVGMPAIPKGVDWTSIWHKELTIKGAYAYGVEDSPSRTATTFELALEGAAKIADRLRLLATRTFPLRDFKLAFGEAMNVGRSRSVKTLFRIDEGSSSG
jgi:threonine dehydrogenase-like Zn-dependent dehydrogenase